LRKVWKRVSGQEEDILELDGERIVVNDVLEFGEMLQLGGVG
jgi:hypothetical protein